MDYPVAVDLANSRTTLQVNPKVDRTFVERVAVRRPSRRRVIFTVTSWHTRIRDHSNVNGQVVPLCQFRYRQVEQTSNFFHKLIQISQSQRSDAIRHVRVRHFNLPRTFKQQQEAGIQDDRDPLQFIDIQE